MAKTLRALPKDISGRRFRTDEGVRFEVVNGEYFAERRISRQHSRYLTQLREGLLVSASFFGQPVPLITVEGGVVRLVEIKSQGDTLKGSATISERLGVVETRQPVGLYLV